MFRLLTVCEQKEKDKASQLIIQTLDFAAKKASKKIKKVNKRLTDKMGKLIAHVYKIQYEKCQEVLKLWDMGQNITKDITYYRAQASSIFSKV